MKYKSSNPFSTRFTAPGQILWLDRHCSVEQVYRSWISNNRSGCLVGPHGSGKSTLLEHLVPMIGRVIYRSAGDGSVHINQCGEEDDVAFAAESSDEITREMVVWHQLRRSCPTSMRIRWDLLKSQPKTLVLDGYEQLGPILRCRLIAARMRYRFGLIVTSHRSPWWLTTLCKLEITPEVAAEIILKILTDTEVKFAAPDSNQLEKMLRHHRGNMREVLMELYDQFESQNNR